MSDILLDEETRSGLTALMESRANVYRLLSRCFRSEVDEALARDIAEAFAFESDDATLMEALASIKRAAAVAADDEQALELLAVTFDRVFFGMGPLTARHAFPYESVYTSDRGIMMQEAYAAMTRTLREQALVKDASFTEPEDHLAVELAFMATLADRTVAFLSARDEAGDAAATETVRQSLAFAQAHLLNWIGRFCAELVLAATPDGEESFYAALARFTARFVEGDAELLEEML